MGRKLEFTKPVSSPCATQLMLWICRAPAASIWFEIWGVLDPDQNNFDFYRKISKKNRFFHAISQKNSIFQAKIGHLQQLLRKLYYFYSKVTTFEHTPCT